jgi:5-methyltetrahydrofolate--homocysteine methyltransferase
MTFVAKEMQRRGMNVPLLIGGATTSRKHTAVRIAPCYGNEVVHVLDASRAVNTVASLLDAAQRKTFDADNRKEQLRLRRQHENQRDRKLLTYEEARRRRPSYEFGEVESPTPAFTGCRVLERMPIADIEPYIDWRFFFSAWELKGDVPSIFEDPSHGSAAHELYEHAQALLSRIRDERLLTANAVYGFWPAAADGDDLVLYLDETREGELARFPMLRQQSDRGAGATNLSLVDFVAPREALGSDYVGAFAVTAGIGADELAKKFERDDDDYNAILVKALADRLAEALAEMLHARVRKEWGYAADEALSKAELAQEKYRGIRPAFGYPACPDHTSKRKLFELLSAGEVGLELTEHMAMLPAASVSGLYFAHPKSHYFNVGPIGRDQVQSYAERKGMSLREVERWLMPNLAYDPAD